MKALYTDIFREIKKSFGRFISMTLLISLGVFAFSGLRITGHDMRITASQYFDTYQIADATVQSTFGLRAEDQTILQQLDNVEAIEFSYSKDLIIAESVSNIRLTSLTETVSTYHVVSGQLPTQSNEIALDTLLQPKHQIGDTISLVTNDGDSDLADLTQSTFTIVGFVRNPEYLDNMERDKTQIGTGTLAGFGVTTKDAFNMDYYATAHVRFKNRPDAYFTKGYEDFINKQLDVVKNALANRPEAVLSQLKAETETNIKDGYQKIDNTLKQLDTYQKELNAKKHQLNLVYNDLNGKRNQLNNGLTLLNQQIAQVNLLLETLPPYTSAIANDLTAINHSLTIITNLLTPYESTVNDLVNNNQLISQIQPQLTQIKNLNEQLLVDYQNFVNSHQMNLLTDSLTTNLLSQQQGLQLWTQSFNVLLTQLTHSDLSESDRLLLLQQCLSDLTTLINTTNQAPDGFSNFYTLVNQQKTELLNRELELKNQLNQLQEGFVAYEQQLVTLNQATNNFNIEKDKTLQTIERSRIDLADAQEKLDDLKLPSYLYRSHNNFLGHKTYKDAATQMDALATVFPVFLFFVALLVSLTTMTRMIDEQRIQVGTLKALGYTKRAIMTKFIIYSSTASLLGVALGFILGNHYLPTIIFNAYGLIYDFSPLILIFSTTDLLLSAIIALLCTTGAAIAVSYRQLQEKTTNLLRNKAPKKGSRILLEKIPFIWNRLSFSYKVTARNIFRYKQRMLMTIFGVAGCTGLIITGFGIKNSIVQIIPAQFDAIQHYDLIVKYDENRGNNSYNSFLYDLENNPNIKQSLLLHTESVSVQDPQAGNIDINLFAIPDHTDIGAFMTIRQRKSQYLISIPNDGVVVSEKLASLLNKRVGDTIKIYASDNQGYELLIKGISELYLGHQMYLSETAYQRTFGTAVSHNTALIIGSENSDLNQLSSSLLNHNVVLGLEQMNMNSENLNKTLSSLDLIMIVMTTIAIILAIVVLYNLNNINIAERIRELSTIKVLGFYAKEVTNYIYRESHLLTFLGALFGCLFGYLLHRYICQIMAPDIVMFYPNIPLSIYLVSMAITMVISLVIMVIMHQKLKHIDMVEALKSTE